MPVISQNVPKLGFACCFLIGRNPMDEKLSSHHTLSGGATCRKVPLLMMFTQMKVMSAFSA
jgi:hypothetical protein